MTIRCSACNWETEKMKDYSEHVHGLCPIATGTWHQRNREYVKKYGQEWRKNNKIRLRDYQKNYLPIWRKNNPEKVKELRKNTREKNRNNVLKAYGNRCTCCGEIRNEFLSIDHMNGNGRKHRRENGLHNAQSFYTWLRRNNYPEGFQVLCHNCNCAKGYYGKCPHQNK